MIFPPQFGPQRSDVSYAYQNTHSSLKECQVLKKKDVLRIENCGKVQFFGIFWENWLWSGWAAETHSSMVDHRTLVSLWSAAAGTSISTLGNPVNKRRRLEMQVRNRWGQRTRPWGTPKQRAGSSSCRICKDLMKSVQRWDSSWKWGFDALWRGRLQEDPAGWGRKVVQWAEPPETDGKQVFLRNSHLLLNQRTWHLVFILGF